MRVYLHHGDFTVKITLPKKWRTGPVKNLTETFVEAYNKKHADAPLSLDAVHLETASGRALAESAVVDACCSHKDDLHIKDGPSPPASRATTTSDRVAAEAASAATEAAAPAPAAAAAPTAAEVSAAAKAEGKVRCRNYGCNQWYHEAENTDTACLHHVKPPIFHETKKGWSCCPDACVWDWDEFMKLPGCTRGPHSTVDPKVKFAMSPTVAAANAAGEAAAAAAGAGAGAAAPAPAPVLRSVDDFNRENPDAATAASSAARVVSAGPPKPKPRSDGKAVCVRHGCRKEYVVVDNADGVCRHHVGQPVFHDGGKHWSCCPTQVKYDFDAFMKVPGCATGMHTDGS